MQTDFSLSETSLDDIKELKDILYSDDDHDQTGLLNQEESIPVEAEDKNKPKEGAIFALFVMILLNTFNFIDRYIPSATKQLIQNDFNLTDTETGYSVMVFLIVYMCMSPIFGTLADRGVNRKMIIAFGVIAWSISSASAYFATNFATFLVSRAFVGVGESSFTTIAPVLLSDFYPPSKRNKILSILYISSPVGAALGFLIGGTVGQYLGWRYSFLFTGIPGLISCILIYWIKDPGRGAQDEHVQEASLKETLIHFSKNHQLICVNVAQILFIFSIGGMADWLPTYFSRAIDGVDIKDASIVMGGTTAAGGFLGTAIGAFLGDFLKGKTKQPYFATCAIGIYTGSIFIAASLFVKNFYGNAVLIALGQILMFSSIGPTSAILMNVTPPTMRTRGAALNIFSIHVLGDAISPVIIGAISDASTILWGVIIVPIVLVFSSLVYACGWRLIDEVSYQEIIEKSGRNLGPVYVVKSDDSGEDHSKEDIKS